MNHVLEALVSELRKRELDVEYRGEGDNVYLVGKTELADELVLNALKAGKPRMLKEILKPAFEAGHGQPVRLHSTPTTN